MLRSWRAIGLSRRIGHKRAVTECPKSVNTFNFKVRVDPDPATLFCARDKIENRIWRYARCPDQRRTWDTDSAGELDFVTPDCCDFAFGMNLNIAFPQLLVGIASRRKSLMLAIVSTPANPPPATTNVSNGDRSAPAHSLSASSRWAINRLRN